MRIICEQTILMKYHALLLFLKSGKIWNCRLLQIIGGALWVNLLIELTVCIESSEVLECVNISSYSTVKVRERK